MQFFKGRKPKLKGFYALQSNYFEKCFPWVNTTDIAVTQAHQTLVQAGRTTQQCHTCCSDFVVMKNAKLRISWREVGAMWIWVIIPAEKPYHGLRNILHWFMYLNTCCLLVVLFSMVMEHLGAGVLLEEVYLKVMAYSISYYLCLLCVDEIVINQLLMVSQVNSSSFLTCFW